MTNMQHNPGRSKTWSLARWGVALLLLGTGCASSAGHTGAATAWSGKSSVLDYYAGGCDGGDANACENAARALTNPSTEYHNDALALEFRTRACNASAYFCGDLGQAYLTGQGAQKDESRGIGYLDRACAAKNTTACSAAVVAHQQVRVADKPKAEAPVAQAATESGAAQAKDAAPAAKKQANKKPAKKHAKRK
jgi:TPR repeat protein